MNKVPLTLADIAQVLRDYRARYRWLDVFPAEVKEIVENAQIFHALPQNTYRVNVGEDQLEMRHYPDSGIVRFCLVENSAVPLAALAGAAIGASSSNRKPKDVENVILGLLIGGLMGAAIDKVNKTPDENRIMTLAFDHQTGNWRAYEGPYAAWARAALKPAV